MKLLFNRRAQLLGMLVAFIVIGLVLRFVASAQEPMLRITAPQPGDVWQAGQTYTIRWEAQNIDYRSLGGLNMTMWWNNTLGYFMWSGLNPSQGQFQWTIPTTFNTYSGYEIHLNDPVSRVEASSGKFTILASTQPQPVSPLPSPLNPPVLLVQVQGSSAVYAIVGNKKHWIPNETVFNSYGFRWSDVKTIAANDLNQYTRASLLQAVGDNHVYYITDAGRKRLIPTLATFYSYNDRWEDVVKVMPNEIAAYPNVILIRGMGEIRVYKLEKGKKRWTSSAASFNRHNFDWADIAPVNSTELNAYPNGAVIN